MMLRSQALVVWLLSGAVCSVLGKTVENSAIDRVRKRHTQDLFEQKNALESRYREQIDRLVKERIALTEQLAYERHARCSIEEHGRCSEQRVMRVEEELVKLKKQTVQEGLQGEKKWQDLYNTSVQERDMLSAECEAFKGELQLAKRNINTLKLDGRKYREQREELMARQQKIQEQQECYQRLIDVLASKDNELLNKEKCVTALTGTLYAKSEQVSSLECTIKELTVAVEHERTGRQQAKAYIRDLELKQAEALCTKELLAQEIALLKREVGGVVMQPVTTAKQQQDHVIADTRLAQNKV